MTIWAFNEPGYIDFVSKSVVEGISRFGWSYFDTADLNMLKNKQWKKMNKKESECWKKSSFMLEIQKDDWIVHINVPEWGKCTAAKVISEYSFEHEGNPIGDFRHMIKVDKESVIIFDRNDDNVLPIVSRKLKLRGRYWRIYCEDEFFKSLNNIKTKATVNLEGLTRGCYYLKKELDEPLKIITNLIHKNHPGKELEKFIAEIFRKMPNVNEVDENGFGWGTDYGADLIVKYQSGLQIDGLEKIETLVVQIKSYDGEHWETNSVSQIETAIEEFEADAGMLITTAEKTTSLEKAIDNLANKISKPVSLLAGIDVAKFAMKYYSHELLAK